MRKGLGTDRRRDPTRILAVLREVGADVVALQECDRRLGERASVLPRPALAAAGWEPVVLNRRAQSLGWHGNAVLVRGRVEVVAAHPLDLPTLEPRGAVLVDLAVDGRPLRVVGMHLDLSGLWRRRQLRAIVDAAHGGERAGGATVLLGDMNHWGERGALTEFGPSHRVLNPGPSFHARRPVAALDRIVLAGPVEAVAVGVHHSALARMASDHLPVWADVVI